MITKKKMIAAGIFFVILAAEIMIALFVDDSFVRPFFGDVLAVICVYFFVRIFLTEKPRFLAPFAVLFAFSVELIQLTRLSEFLGKYPILSTLVGGTFDPKDLICYVLGGAACFVLELKFSRKTD